MKVKTHPFYQYIHHSNLIEGFDSYAMDKYSLEVWEWLQGQGRLSHDAIKYVQRRITFSQPNFSHKYQGKYRTELDVEVRVGGHSASAAADVQLEMNLWLASFVKNLSPKLAHIQFEQIHPFVDGNGRTGRMLMWWMEIRNGQEPTFIDESKRLEYYDWFKIEEIR